MADLFGPVTLEGGATGATSFTKSGAGYSNDYSNALETSVKIFDRVKQSSDAEKEVAAAEKEQEDFLNYRESGSDIATLKRDNPAQAAALKEFERSSKGFKDLMMVDSRAASVAISRRDAAAKRALSKAPLFANEIRAHLAENSGEFDTEAERLVSLREDRDAAMQKLGYLNVDDPIDIANYNAHMRLKAQNDLNSQIDVKNKRDVINLTQGTLLDHAATIEQSFKQQLEAVGYDMSKLDQSTRDAYITQINAFKGNIPTLVRNIALQSGATPSSLGAEDYEEMGITLSSLADTMLTQVQMGAQATASNNALKLYENQEVFELRKSSPSTFQLGTLSNFFNPESPLGSALSSEGTRNVSTFLRFSGREDFSPEIYLAMFKENTPEQNKSAVTDQAMFLKDVRKKFENSSENIPLGVALKHGKVLNNAAEFAASYPKLVNDAYLSELISTVNSKSFQKHFNSLDDSVAIEYSDKMSRAIRNYTDRNLIPRIQRDLDSASMSIVPEHVGRKKTLTSVKPYEYVEVDISPNGGVTFLYSGNEALTSLDDERRAVKNVRKLNERYGNLSLNMAITSSQLSGKGEGVASRREQAAILFAKLIPGKEIVLDEEEASQP